MDRYLKETEMLDYSSKNIRQLIAKRKWDRLDAFRRVQAIYNFVRDEILFGYNTDDSIPASKVLADGYGQCNTCGRAAFPAGCTALPLTRRCKRVL